MTDRWTNKPIIFFLNIMPTQKVRLWIWALSSISSDVLSWAWGRRGEGIIFLIISSQSRSCALLRLCDAVLQGPVLNWKVTSIIIIVPVSPPATPLKSYHKTSRISTQASVRQKYLMVIRKFSWGLSLDCRLRVLEELSYDSAYEDNLIGSLVLLY